MVYKSEILGHLIGGANFKIDLTVAKRKYYGSFNIYNFISPNMW